MAANRRPFFTAPLIIGFDLSDPALATLGGNLLANASDRDPDDVLRLAAVNGMAAGPILGRFGRLDWDPLTAAFTYTPDAATAAARALGEDVIGRESFVITVADASGLEATGRLFVAVTGVNDAPDATDKVRQVTEDGTVQMASGSFLAGARDPDRGDSLRVVAVNGGTATSLEGTYGTLTWDPASGGFSYVLANAASAVQGLGRGERTVESFSFTIADSLGATDTATLTIRVNGVNDAPVAPDLTAAATAVPAGPVRFPTLGLLSGVTDADGDTVVVTSLAGADGAVITAPGRVQGRFGSLEWQAGGNAIYRVDGGLAATRALGDGELAADRFAETLSDGQGGVTIRTLTVNVRGVNDPASITGALAGAVAEDGVLGAGGFVTVTDPDPGQAGFQAPVSLTGLYGAFGFDAAAGIWTYWLDNDRAAVQALGPGQTAQDSLVLRSIDGTTATVTVTILGTEDLPVAAPDRYVVAEDGVLLVTLLLGGTLLANDSGGDGPLSVVAGTIASTAGGTVTLQSDGGFVFTPRPDFFGEDSFTYQVADAGGPLVTGTASVTVTPVAERIAPVLLSDIAAGIGGFKILGESGGDQAGYAVARSIDKTLDGLDEILIGAPGWDYYVVPPNEDGTYWADSGAAYLVVGRAGGSSVGLSARSRINVDLPAGQAGTAIADVGDDDGDGNPQSLIGAPGASPGGLSDAGYIYAYGNSPILWQLLSQERISGLSIGDAAGSAVAAGGDITGDGLDEWLIGAPGTDSADGPDAGAMYLVRSEGRSQNPIITPLEGASAGDRAGSSVAAAGDVNGDGRPDLLVGAPGLDAPGRLDSGGAYVLFTTPDGLVFAPSDVSKTDAAGFRIVGEIAGSGAGKSVAPLGDLNGDGLADILIGAPGTVALDRGDSGAAYVVFGRTATSDVDLAQVAQGIGGFRILGETGGNLAGFSVANAGDVNGDGITDLLIGAPQNWAGGLRNGAAYLVFGKTDTAEVDLARIAAGEGGFKILGENSFDAAGWAVSAGGDVNGDGLADLLVGAPQNDGIGLTDNGAAYVIFGQAAWRGDSALA